MKKLLVGLMLTLFLVACGGSVTPEMEEFLGAFGSQEQLTSVIEKYAASPEIVPEALNACNLGKPLITNTEHKDDGTVVYSAEAKVEKCEKSENAVGTIRIFDIGWKDGKIVSFEWQGPKSGNVEY